MSLILIKIGTFVNIKKAIYHLLTDALQLDLTKTKKILDSTRLEALDEELRRVVGGFNE